MDKKSKGGGGDKSSHQKQKQKLNTKGQAKTRSGAGDGGGDDDFEVWMKSRQLIKPPDQLELTEAELGEEITKMLTPTNTNVVPNLVIYSFKDQAFVQLPLPGNTVELFSMEGTALHLESEEAREQIEELGEIGYPLPPPRSSFVEAEPPAVVVREDADAEEEEGEEGDESSKKDAETGDADGDDDGEEDDESKPEADETEPDTQEADDDAPPDEPSEAQTVVTVASSRKRKLINQFNFCERAALTFTYPKRNVDTQTIPPPRSQYGANVLQWNIYDSYAEDYAAQQLERDKKEDKHVKSQRKEEKKVDKKELAEELNRKYLKCWLILERMINQNIFDDVSNDYRYWEDPADEFRECEGTLLPLWKFQFDRVKKMSVTDILFNPHYYDMFAVCFGSYEFTKQPADGSICLFTIKNPSFPDYISLYNGNVSVYNLKTNFREPLYESVGVNCKHADCVWEIKWGPDMTDGEINFYSLSGDGCVFNWVLMQNKLAITTITTLFLDNATVAGPDGTELRLKSCCSCMKFHPVDPEIFLVGTMEGTIYKCSIAYSSKYLMTYPAHNLAVYRIDFNRYNSNIFISCSGDWRVKIWEDMRPEPLFIFDLGSSVGDVKWAPYSSTVFGAVTGEGKVYIYDLNVNKYKPNCIQAIVPKSKNKLTRIAFNEKLPFIVVGDDKGTTTSLKLSPNLRVMVKPPKKQLYLDQNTLQIQKLERLLSLVRELPEGAVIPEATTTAQS